MKHKSIFIGLLALFFLGLTERVTLPNIAVSILVAYLVFGFSVDKGVVFKHFNLKTLPIWLSFVPMLFYEVVRANIGVAIIALSTDMKLDPHVVEYESLIKDEWLLTVLANIITLTPGTMSVDLTGNRLTIHCLNNEYAEGLGKMSLEKLLLKIEGECIG